MPNVASYRNFKNNNTLRAACAAMGLAVAAATGCIGYSPGGNMASNDEFTYWSTPHLPQTVTLVDTRTGERFWTYEIPVGKEVVMRFYPETNSGQNFPDTMRWDVFDVGDSFGTLRNVMPVPDRFSRRVDVDGRPSPEAAPAAAPADSAASTQTGWTK